MRNKVTITGIITDKWYIESKRMSGVIDKIPYRIHYSKVDELNLPELISSATRVKVTGVLATSMKDGHKSTFIYIEDIEPAPEHDINLVEIEGYICKKDAIRVTPAGKQITEYIVAYNCEDSPRSFYPSCIAWGSSAKVMEHQYCVGDKVLLIGRFQSREYLKKYEDGVEEIKTAYEISTLKIYREYGE